MINYTVNIDTLKLQVEFNSIFKQHRTMDGLTNALIKTYKFLNIKNAKNKIDKSILVRSIYTAGKKILEIKSGSYLSGHYKDSNRKTIYYISTEIAGLKQYTKNDKIAHDCLIRLVAYLNTNEIDFEYTGIDIAVDMFCPFRYVYAFCNKKAAGVKYYKVYERQPYISTHYIEKYILTHNRVMKRSKTYYKPAKDKYIKYPITRFELKLQSSFFNRYPYEWGMLQNELNRYHILYFPTLEEKDAALSLYAEYEDTIRRRDLHKLGLDKYRIYPNTSEIEWFLTELYNVYEHDLDLPVEKVDNGWF